MSYSRTYHATAHYDGYAPYSVHAGENTYRGSVHYSGDVPITFTAYVNTDPFDYSIDSCNNKVNSLNGAVIAMNGAQCAEIKRNSDKISKHIVDGFFNVVKSEISQDSARLRNIIVSQIALLQDHALRVRQQKETMTTDYNRISGRYIKIFKELDEECRKRVQSLDSKAFEISSEITEKQLRVPGMAVGGFMTSSTEECLTADRITLSHLKSNTRDTINSLLDNISKDLRFSRNTELMVYEKHCEKEEPVYVPVLFLQTDDLHGRRNKCYTNDVVARSSGEIYSEVDRFFSESDTWSEEDAVNANIDREFNTLAEQVSDKRVYDEIMRLKNGARTEVYQARS